MHVSANRQNVPHSSVDVRKRKIRKREVAGLLASVTFSSDNKRFKRTPKSDKVLGDQTKKL